MSAKPKSNTERINVFFSESAVQRLKELAEEKGTSVSGIVRMIVLEYLAREKQNSISGIGTKEKM